MYLTIGVLARAALTSALGLLFVLAELLSSAVGAPVPRLLRDINPGIAESFAEMFVPALTSGDLRRFAYFRANDGVHGFELWRTDGTVEGTQLVLDLRPGPANGFPSNITSVEGRLYFNAYDTPEAVGSKVFVSDGTAEGTLFLADTWPELESSPFGPPLPGNFTALGSENVLFTATGPDDGTELWWTDGTPDGTFRVKDIHPGAESSIPVGLTDLDDVAIFAADDSFVEMDGLRTYDRELWRTDGTAAGTLRVADIHPGVAPSIPIGFIRFGSDIYFRADDGAHGSELWKSDGTASGTMMVADIHPNGSSDLQDLTVFGDYLVFFASDDTSGYELFRSDGTAAGTELIKDINPLGDSAPFNLTVWGERLFFTADDGVNGRELWISDGTEAGTQMLLNLNGADRSSPESLTIVGDRLFFTTIVPNDAAGTVQTELWVTDGTATGTELVVREPGSSFGYAITNLTALGNTLLFTAPNGMDELGHSINTELFAVTIPEPSTTILLTCLAGIFFVTKCSSRQRRSLWDRVSLTWKAFQNRFAVHTRPCKTGCRSDNRL